MADEFDRTKEIIDKNRKKHTSIRTSEASLTNLMNNVDG